MSDSGESCSSFIVFDNPIQWRSTTASLFPAVESLLLPLPLPNLLGTRIAVILVMTVTGLSAGSAEPLLDAVEAVEELSADLAH